MDTPDNIQKSKIILYFMGYYFQVQDDYLDCFGDPNVTGKIGTDIQDFKCSWLIVNALRKASPEQRIILEENYGKDDSVKIAKVKEVYVDLALPQHFKKFEDLYTELITFLIQCLPDVMPGDHQEKETNIKLSNRLDEFKQKHNDFDELFPGDYKEIPDGIFNLSNGFNTDDLVELDSIVGDGGCKRVLPKELFWHYHNLIYKRVK